jgi:phage-related protein
MDYTNIRIMRERIKPIRWLGSSRKDLKAFPDDARDRTGFELFQVQKGENPSDFKAMPSIGAGVYEIRIRTEIAHRLVYVSKHEEAVYVLHAFEKRTRKTSSADVRLARRRLAEVNKWRNDEGRR